MKIILCVWFDHLEEDFSFFRSSVQIVLIARMILCAWFDHLE